MISFGRYNALSILRDTPPGIYLEAGADHNGILLPRRYVTADMVVGERVHVFVYRDSEGRPVATTDTPRVEAGQSARLRVVNVKPGVGVFLDWGLAKDLLLPFREQGERPLEVGDHVIVAVYVDPSDRIVATTRLEPHLEADPPAYDPNEAVDVLIYDTSPLGYKAVVNQTYAGLLYRSETSDTLSIGDALTAYVKEVRPDGRLDLRRDPAGYDRVASVTDTVLHQLDEAGGTLPFNDKSSPESIRDTFGTSKKAFKQALGALYKQQAIRFTDDGIARTRT